MFVIAPSNAITMAQAFSTASFASCRCQPACCVDVVGIVSWPIQWQTVPLCGKWFQPAHRDFKSLTLHTQGIQQPLNTLSFFSHFLVQIGEMQYTLVPPSAIVDNWYWGQRLRIAIFWSLVPLHSP